MRLVAAILVVSLPLMVLLGVLLTTQASASLTSSGERKGEEAALIAAIDSRFSELEVRYALAHRLLDVDRAVDAAAQ